MSRPRKDYLDNKDFQVLWHGFDGSVIYNKQTKQQEWVRNAEYQIPVRMRYATFQKKRKY